ncbi:MBG domain-containing protein [Galactobacillus timonensis]|uniref:MBG domain-containing protein n=1 Tax=Galactobacillus timonensis TaxID=2041840 RepID=UPI000C855528|nr:MBG domain-containing protein [Galactobacillus timonensis]
MAEEGNAEEQPGTEVTETVEAPLPEPEPAPEVTEEEATPAEEAAPQETVAAPVESTEPEAPAPTESKEPEGTAAPVPTVEAEAPAQPEETAVPEPTPEVSPETTPESTPEVTPEAEATAEPTPEAEEEETVIYMPAGTFSGSTSQMTVTVAYDDHTFPIGTTMRVTDVSKHEAIAAAEQSTEGDEEVIDAVAVDITFLNANNEEIQPEGAVSVSMVPYTPLETTETSTTEVIHKDDSGNTQVIDAAASAQNATFDADSFSIYVISITDGKQVPAIATYIFHGADNQKVISTQKVKNGETVYAPSTPEKSGYKFLGWSKKPGVSSLQEGDPGSFSEFKPSVTDTTEVKLYPVFQQVYYVFFLDGQGRVSTTKEGASGDKISVADVTIPLDSTHSVTGWYTEAKLTNKVESVTLSDHNVTLYPNVEEGHYLYFASGEGASYVEPEFVAANEGTSAPAEPTRPGYTFKYWSTSEEGPEYKFGRTISENITLHAVWNANNHTKYTVIYWWENANDNNYSYHESSFDYGVSGKTVRINDVLKSYEGFELNKEKTNQSDVTISGDGSTIINIYYSRKTYEVTFFKYTKHVSGLFGHIVWYEWNEMEDLRISAKYGANISDRWPTSTSKIWGTQKGDNGQGEEPYQSGISTMPLNGAAFYYVSRDGEYTMNLNYYLKGLDGKYYLHHTDSFKSNDDGWSTTAEDHYDIEGFTYTNNVEDGTKFQQSSRNVYEISFKYERNEYSIKFVNGDSTTSVTFKYGADISKVDLKTAPKHPVGIPSDYLFAGWFDNELGVGDQITSLSGTMPANNITLYAKWVAPTYDGTIHLTIEDNGKTIPFNVAYGQTIDENDMPQIVDHNGKLIQAGDANKGTVTVPQGYTWAGWATKTGDGSFVLFNFNTKVHGNITFYPYYINGEKYTVTYELGKGTGTAPTDSKLYAENSYADIQLATGVKPPTGKTFLYWNDGTNNFYPGDKVKITKNLELIAVYGDTSALTSITYHSNYPEGSQLDEKTTTVDKQANNTAIKLEKAGFAAPTGYYFSYWKDGSGKRYDVGTNIGIDNTSDNNLYAVWKQKKEITLTANSETITYDGTEHTTSGVKTNTFTIDNVTYIVSGFSTQNPKGTNAGTYTNNILNTDSIVVKNGNTDVTYQFTVNTENGSLNIMPKAVTVTADSKSKTYGEKDPELTAQVSGTLGNDTVRYTLSREKGEVVGSYTITPSGEASQGNYTVTYETGTFTISKSGSLTLTANGYEGEYDGKSHAASAIAIVTEGTTISYQVGNGEWTTEAPSIKDVGEQKVNVKAENANYETASTTVTLKVKPKAVIVTAENTGKTYGDPDPELTAKVSGTLDNDTVSYSLSRAEGEAVGTYTITPSGEANQGNYTVSYETGTFTISESGSLTLTANGFEGEYDGEAHAASASASVTEGTTISYQVGNGEWTTKAPSIKDVGEQTVNVKAENANYKTASTTVTLKVTPKPVTVTADNKSKTYNEKDPELTATVSKMVGKDSVDYTLSREKGEAVGTYKITPSGEASQGNYTVTYETGTFTIRKSGKLTLTANGYDGEYDGNSHAAGASVSVTEGTTISYQVGGAWTTKAPSITDVGEKTVSVKAENANYETASITVTLKVTPKAVTVKAENKSKTYGETDPKLTATVSETLGTDTVSYTLSRAEGENVGEYAITPKGDKDQGNYTVTYVPGKLTISKAGAAGLNLSATGYKGEYDGNSHAVSASASEGTTISYQVGNEEWTTEVPSIKNVGEQTVNVKAEKANFETAEKTVTLKVTPKAVTVTAENKSKTYGEKDPELTATISGTLDNDTVSYKLSRAEGKNVGTYKITPSGEASQGNYAVTYVAGTLTINKADISDETMFTVSQPGDVVYNGAEQKQPVTVARVTPKAKNALAKFFSSLASLVDVNADEALKYGTDYTLTYSENLKDVGTVRVTVKGLGNYTGEVTKTYEITPAPLKVTTSSAEKVYDGKPLTAGGTLEGLVNETEKNAVKFTVKGSQTEVGSSVNSYEIVWGNIKESNYSLTKVLGTLKVTARPEPSKPKPAASSSASAPVPAPVSTRFIPRTAAYPAEGKEMK